MREVANDAVVTTASCQPCRVPQRRQNRAVAESDKPQFEQGWIPGGAGVTVGPVERGGPATSRADAAQMASLDARARSARRAMLGDSMNSGRAGHCGSRDAWTGTWSGPAGVGVGRSLAGV